MVELKNHWKEQFRGDFCTRHKRAMQW